MLEWKSRLMILLGVAAVLAAAFGESLLNSAHNFGW